jgi:peptidoglycan/xylan/chitin deacetylase (PgdA/CDA1 family)
MVPRFPVLIYHGVVAGGVSPGTPHRKYVLAEEKFVAQLAEIRRQGIAVAPLKTAWSNGASAGQSRPSVVLTFDDGLASHYEVAFALLLRDAMEADFFINPATIGNAGYLSWQQIAAMQRYGMSFHSHSQEHVDLTRLPTTTLTRHLRSSKQCLEDRLGHSVEFLAAPFGLMDRRVLDVAAQEGYLAVCNAESRLTMPGAANINRIAVYRRTPLRTFRQFLQQRPFPYSVRKLRSALLYMPKKLRRRMQPARFGVGVPGHEK